MVNKFMKNKKINSILLYLLSLVVLSLFVLNGCSDTIKGEKTTNMKPIVQFVNIPPEGEQFSRNPEVYWIGSDPDGLVDYYRYHIGIYDEVVAAGGIDAYLQTLNASDWTQIDINHNESNPYTTNVLPLTADTLNPVSNPVGQYIFLQAFDLEDLGSDVAARLFNRNDNPPETQILDISSQVPFVNSIFEGGIVTGCRFSWRGFDVKDYDEIGLTPPPFDFEWRLFGPFSKTTLAKINDSLTETVIVTDDAQLLHQGDLLIQCQSTQVDTIINSIPTTITVEVCDTTLLDSAFFKNKPASVFYSFHTILHVEDTTISSKLVTSSFNGVDEWVQDTRDTLFNVYKNFSSDTTVEYSFIFWIRSRDDAFVKDLTPAFVSFPVINPKYERSIAVIDFTPLKTSENYVQYPHIDTAKSFWHNLIHRWAAANRPNDTSFKFDTSVFTFAQVGNTREAGKTGIDYIITTRYPNGIPIKYLLKHKLLILYNDSHEASGFIQNTVQFPEILSAMDAGINVWATWRNPLLVNATQPTFIPALPASSQYSRYFGVLSMSYTGWYANANLGFPFVDSAFKSNRVEDFKGTYSIDESTWPSLDIDTSLLHTRYLWRDDITQYPYSQPWFHWIDTIAALPEVNWASRAPGTEVMYLYKSVYGADDQFGYEGAPVGHRFESNLFKTVHFNFTLLAIDSLQAQSISNSVLNWLYNENLNSSSVKENRYPNARNQFSIEEARRQYELRLIDQAQLRENSGE